MNPQPTSNLIGKVLAPAVNLWLHSQLDQVEALEINIGGKNRQILSGYIPQVHLRGRYPIYQGLHLGEVKLQGQNIKINLGQLLKGQPLRLLEPIIVEGRLVLTQEHLNLSLTSNLLSQALTDLLLTFKKTACKANAIDSWSNCQIQWQKASIQPEKLSFQGIVTDYTGKLVSNFTLRSGLTLANPHTILLKPVQIETSQENITLQNYEIDLGSQVNLEFLSLEDRTLNCKGSATVISE